MTLKKYTEPLSKEESKLFITVIQSHRAVTSSTLARWLKEVLRMYTSLVNVYIVRGAS